MGFKKIRYNSGEEIADFHLKDTSGANIEKWVFMMSDFPEFVRIMCKKFGIRNIYVKNTSKVNKDMDWAI